MERDQEASIDDDMLFGTDSEDSFTKDYNITKDILRKERIYKRDKARFEIEKKQRETKRVQMIEKAKKDEIERLEKEKKEREAIEFH